KRSGLIDGLTPGDAGGTGGGAAGDGGVGASVGAFGTGTTGLALNFLKASPSTSSGSVLVSKLSSFRNALTISLSLASKSFRGGAIVTSPLASKLIPMYSFTLPRSKNRV